jgi:hypothetical protein
MDKMLGLCIACGDEWREAAEFSVPRMEKFTGIECRIVGEEIREHVGDANPSWGKLWLQEMFPNRDLLIFDADIVAAKPWSPVKELKGFDFVFAHECQSDRLWKECQWLGLDILRYGNSGLMMVSKFSRILFETRPLFPSFGSWAEQSGVNKTVMTTKERVKMLPRSANRLASAHPSAPKEQAHCHAANIHFCNSSKRPGTLLGIMREMAQIVDTRRKA